MVKVKFSDYDDKVENSKSDKQSLHQTPYSPFIYSMDIGC